jgi:lipoprotein-anchoring transpeptidase ErfK/SrfK
LTSVARDKGTSSRRARIGLSVVTFVGVLVGVVVRGRRTRQVPRRRHARGRNAKDRGVSRRARRIRRRRHARVGLALAIIVLLIAGIGALATRRGDREQVLALATTTTQPVSSTTTVTTEPPPEFSYIATARGTFLEVFDAPNSPPATNLFPNPWFVNDDPNAAVPLVFHVEAQRSDGWVQVLLPIRPNGSTGWVRESEVVLTPTLFRITVELGAHRLRVYRDKAIVMEDSVAVGTPATPTPTGHFYIRALLKAPRPGSVYGPFAYALSGYSEVLQTFNGGDAEFGIHGNDDESKLGTDASHGCVRMSNDGITTLTSLLPLGTPVEITA